MCAGACAHSPQLEALRKHLNTSSDWREHNFPLLVRAQGEGGGSSKCQWQQGTSLASCRAAGSIKGRASQRGSLAGAAARRGCAGTYDALTNLVTSFLFETRPWTVVSTPSAASGFAFSLSNKDDAQILCAMTHGWSTFNRVINTKSFILPLVYYEQKKTYSKLSFSQAQQTQVNYFSNIKKKKGLEGISRGLLWPKASELFSSFLSFFMFLYIKRNCHLLGNILIPWIN